MQDNLKKPLKYAIILLVMALLVFLANETYQYLYYKLPPKMVSVSIKYLPAAPCRKDTPMFMLIVNDSYREIIKTDFILSVKAGKDSEDIAQLLSRDYSTDVVIAAGDSYEGCWSYPKLYNNKHAPESLLYSIKRQAITFSE